ncbi:hypothetical protein [Lactococcus garvieae]|uniref:Uncharacterized protein n=1 Tax=Lactococcus garvieae TaxID=1363 RepID=A0A1I4GGU5_9LACT|nr:hypothetical protein [Lactococcus garvieae]SFL29175.1 hypothetical protein SAMN05216438_10430 [Lactococcus garvieae]
MNQKEIKAIKKAISEETAFNIGYYAGLPAKLMENEYSFFAAMKEPAVGELLSAAAQKDAIGEFYNIFVTESIQHMNYSEFKEIAPYFFSYQKNEEEILAESIEVTRATYERFQRDATKLFEYEHPSKDLQALLQEVTTKTVSNENQAIAYNPLTEQLAVLENETDVEPFFEEGLITDYRKRASEKAQLADYLVNEVEAGQLQMFFKEAFLNHDLRDEYAGSMDTLEPLATAILEAHPEFEDNLSLIVFDTHGVAENGRQWDVENMLEQDLSIDEIYQIVKAAGYFTASKEEFLNLLYEPWANVGHSELVDYVTHELTNDYIEGLNEILALYDKELVTHTVRGYSQGDVWQLAYMIDKAQNPSLSAEMVKDYLEHEIGAYYRGSLTELAIYDKEGEVIDNYIVDRENFWNEEVAQVQLVTGNNGFIDIEQALKLEMLDHPLSRSELQEFVNSSQSERETFIKSREADENKGIAL